MELVVGVWSAVLCCQTVSGWCKTSSAGHSAQPDVCSQSHARVQQGIQPTVDLPIQKTAGLFTHQTCELPTQPTNGLLTCQTAEQPIPAQPMYQKAGLEPHLSSYTPTETGVGFPAQLNADQQMQLNNGVKQHSDQLYHDSCTYSVFFNLMHKNCRIGLTHRVKLNINVAESLEPSPIFAKS